MTSWLSDFKGFLMDDPHFILHSSWTTSFSTTLFLRVGPFPSALWAKSTFFSCPEPSGFCITVKITCALSVANSSIVSLQFSPHVNRKRTKKDDCALPARCQPKDRVVVAGLVAIHRASREIIKPAKSDSKWAASVMIARLLARYPPEVIKRLYLPDDTYIKSKR